MASLGQYLKDTRSEMRHVAWPSQTQTIVYTVLVAVLSLLIAGYLGVFDYVFTGALSRVVSSVNPTATTQAATSTSSGSAQVATSSLPAGVTVTQNPASGTPSIKLK